MPANRGEVAVARSCVLPKCHAVQVVLLPSHACVFLPHIGSTCLCFQPLRPSLRGRIRSESLCPRLDFVDHHFGQGTVQKLSEFPPICVAGFRRPHGDHSTDFETVNTCIYSIGCWRDTPFYWGSRPLEANF